MKKYILLILFTIMGCAPELQVAPESKAQFEFGPKGQDTDLDLSNLNEQTKASKDNWLKLDSLSAEQKLEMIESVYALASLVHSPSLKISAISNLRQFRVQHQTQSLSFDSSPYVEAMVGSTQAEALEQIKQSEKYLASDSEVFLNFLSSKGAQFQWPAPPTKAQTTIAYMQNYIQWLLRQLPSLGLQPMVFEAIQKELPVRAEALLRKLSAEVEKVSKSSSSVEILKNIEGLAKTMEYVPSAQSAHWLKVGFDLAKKVQSIQDSQDVLAVIVTVYKILGAKDSEPVIAPENKDLYDFLKESDEARLQCLAARSGCRDPIAWMAKKMKILPAIEEMGVLNLKKRIDLAMVSYVAGRLDTELLQAAHGVPAMIAKEYKLAAQEKLKEIQQIKTNYRGFVKKIAQQWSMSKLTSQSGRIRGLEQMQIMAAPGDSGSGIIGQGLYIKTKILNLDYAKLSQDEKTEWALEHINKLLALGGYKTDAEVSARPITQPVEAKINSHKMSLEDILKSPMTFAVPDQVSLSSAYATKVLNPAPPVNVSVMGQAKLLKGLAESVQFLKDWAPTSFDTILGQDTLAHAYPKAPGSLGAKKLFPKEVLLGLSVGNAAVMLKNLLKELSPVFVLAEENRIIWANKYKPGAKEASAMAGVVNLVGGTRDVKVSARDVAEYILALTEFYSALDGIEYTQSSVLLPRSGDVSGPLQEMVAARDQIKMLIVGLANFLSYKMRGSDGWVHEQFDVKGGLISDGPVRILTQFKALEALVRAHEVTKLVPYTWSIQDLYYQLNRSAFDSKLGFYRDIGTLHEGTQVLKILKSLEPHLPHKSQRQLQRLTDSWIALAQVRLQ